MFLEQFWAAGGGKQQKKHCNKWGHFKNYGYYFTCKMTKGENGNAGALVAVGEARSAFSQGGADLGMATHTHSIGVIVPPPDIRAIADKTAAFVAKNGKM